MVSERKQTEKNLRVQRVSGKRKKKKKRRKKKKRDERKRKLSYF